LYNITYMYIPETSLRMRHYIPEAGVHPPPLPRPPTTSSCDEREGPHSPVPASDSTHATPFTAPVAVRCSVLQCVTETHTHTHTRTHTQRHAHAQTRTRTCTRTRIHTHTHTHTTLPKFISLSLRNCYCNALRCTTTHCNALQHNALRCTTTHCNALQHVVMHCNATHCNALQRTATHCNTM